MTDKLLYIFIGIIIAETVVIVLLIRQPDITYKISRLTQKTKRNTNSNVDNDITPTMNIKPQEKAKKRRFKEWRNKRKSKRLAKK